MDKNAEDKGEMGIFEMHYLLNISVVLVRCQFLKTPYLEEVLLLK